MSALAPRFRLANQSMTNAGSYLVLSKALRGMHLGRSKINHAFVKYIPLKDFDKEERDMLLENLYKVTQERDFYKDTNYPSKTLILSHA